MKTRADRLPILVLGCLGAMSATAQHVVTYDADYTVLYKGREAGESTFAVSREAGANLFRFVSRSKLRGLIARIVAPKAVIEDSLFQVTDGRIEPAAFAYQDGSRKGEDNFTIDFDWPTVARLEGNGGPRNIELAAGVLDRGSAQVALMIEAARGAPSPTYEIIDDDGIESYAVTRMEPASTTTGAGEFATERYAQQRMGSSRQTVFWLAPELHHLPVRIEQIRDGEAETVFVLDAVEFTAD